MPESTPAAPGRIFISYRREETAYPAGWLYDRLTAHLGRDQIFKDIDSIAPGDDFVEVISNAVGSCDVLLALIGDRWLTIVDQKGRRRLDDPHDFVRLEIEAALERSVRVIPVLFEGARMPDVEELPPSIAKLVRRHASELSPSRFEFDLSKLLRVIDKTLAEKQAQRETDEQAQREAEANAQREADDQAQREADEQAQREAEAKAQREADEQAQREAEAKAQWEADEQAQREAEAKAQWEAEASTEQASGLYKQADKSSPVASPPEVHTPPTGRPRPSEGRNLLKQPAVLVTASLVVLILAVVVTIMIRNSDHGVVREVGPFRAPGLWYVDVENVSDRWCYAAVFRGSSISSDGEVNKGFDRSRDFRLTVRESGIFMLLLNTEGTCHVRVFDHSGRELVKVPG